jgi:signal peptidase I
MERKAMQWFEVVRMTAALLSRMYLVALMCLGSWAILPLAIGWTPTVVSSGSMLPNVQIGDVVVAQNLNPDQKEEIISTGHVLLATDPLHAGKLVTHRVVNVLKGVGYITKGDANATADANIVPLSNVHGIERLRIPMIGLPIQAFRMGNVTPMIVFTVLTVIAHLIWMQDRKLSRQTVPTKIPPATPLDDQKTDKPRLRKKSLFRFSSAALTSVVVIAISVLFASSAAGFSGASANSGHNFKTTSDFTTAYKNSILADSPFAYYRLNETSGTTITDSSGNARNARYSTNGVTLNVTGALTRNTADKAVTLNGTQGRIVSATATAGPQSLTTQIWFKTSSSTGGKLIGFSTGASNSTVVDRVLYMTNAGKVTFGIDTATDKTIQSPLSYNDGKWHMAVATLSGLNAALYIDGKLIITGATTSAPTVASGFWVGGGGNFSGWASQPTSSFFAGSVDEIAIYTKALTAAQIAADFGAA